MKLLLSGEGPSDFGSCSYPHSECSGADFQQGPMARLLIALLEHLNPWGYSLADHPDSFVYISKAKLEEITKANQNPRKMRFRSKDTAAETRYFFDNAKSLGSRAKQLASEFSDCVITIFFRDVDGTNNNPGQWADKVKSVQDGFAAVEFQLGVPMLPTPKSEAWLLCIATGQPGNNYAALEALPGNDDSPHNAKDRLTTALGGHHSAEQLATWIDDQQPIDFIRLRTMPSFASFEDSLKAVIQAAR
jgi:hypothetical protein